MHRRQDSIRSRLQRKMQLFAHGRRLGHGGGHLRAEVRRVGARESDPADPFDRSHLAQQLGEQRAAPPVDREVAPVGVDVLAEERQLDNPVAGETAHFPEDVAGSPADLRTTNRRDDAKSAAVVAPDLNRDPGRVPRLPSDGER